VLHLFPIYINYIHKLNSDLSFAANINDDITTVTSTVSCLNSSFSSSCSGGCTGSYNIPASCPFCSSPTSGSVCNACPKGTYGGAESELPCQLCPYGQTTVFPPSSTSSSTCVDITQSPTSVPTVGPTGTPSSPSRRPTQSPSALYPLVRVEMLLASTHLPFRHPTSGRQHKTALTLFSPSVRHPVLIAAPCAKKHSTIHRSKYVCVCMLFK